MNEIRVAVAVLLPAAAAGMLFRALRRHRLDIGPRDSAFSGSSRVWQFNVFNAKNYDSRGRRLLPWFGLAQVIQLVGIAYALFRLARR